MSEIFGHDTSRRLPLDRVIADRHGCPDAFLDVPALEHIKLPLSVVSPHAGQVVGPLFLFHRETIVSLLGKPLPLRLHLIRDA